MNKRCGRERPGMVRGLCAALLFTTCVAGAMAAPVRPPAINEPKSAERHVGKVIWTDLLTPDIAAAKQFYSGVFGWTFRDAHVGQAEYSVAYLNGRPVGGLLQRSAAAAVHGQPAWLTFISVRDVDVATRTAVEHGAKVVFEPKNYAPRGRQAVFADPDGAVFAVLASSSGDPPDFLAAPGEWIWSSLLARNPGPEAAFYQALFGYDAFDLASDDAEDHVILSTDNYARASVNALPRDSSRRHPHWLNFVRVEDAVSAAAKAIALGGRVLVEPRLDRHGSKIAVVADPAGAPFGLMEWPQTDGGQEAK
jgi:uncharacterized protein